LFGVQRVERPVALEQLESLALKDRLVVVGVAADLDVEVAERVVVGGDALAQQLAFELEVARLQDGAADARLAAEVAVERRLVALGDARGDVLDLDADVEWRGPVINV